MLPIFIGIRTKLNRVTFMFVLGNILHCLSNMFMTLIEYKGAKYFMILEYYKWPFFSVTGLYRGRGKLELQQYFHRMERKLKAKKI